ncbi:competence type IV pilus minor pilin ComGG [Neobacillus sp. Marseille-QA0830]
MKRQEAGFTYPLTLCLLIVFLLFFSMQVDQLTVLRKLSRETETILLEEYYLHSSVTKIEMMFQAGEAIPAKGTVAYQNGNVDYVAEVPIGTVQKINFTLKLQSGETMIGRGYFDTSLKKFIRWVEL